MYDPSIGRWLEEDPIRTAAGDTNLYRDVHNNPTNWTDRSGLAQDYAIWYPKGTGPLTNPKEHYYKPTGGTFEPRIFAVNALSSKVDYSVKESYLDKGCIGLWELRTGLYVGGPQAGEILNKGNLFKTLQEAKRYQRWVENNDFTTKVTVLFAIGRKDNILEGVKTRTIRESISGRSDTFTGEVVDGTDRRLAQNVFKDAAYLFATAFQDQRGDIIYWEWMPTGVSHRETWVVKHSTELPDRTYAPIIYGVIWGQGAFAGDTLLK